MNGLKDVSKMTDTERRVETAVEGQARVRNCFIDIEKVLKRWSCRIDPMVQISGQSGIQVGFNIVPVVEVKIQ